MGTEDNILDGLVAEFEILLDVDVVLDPEENDGSGDEEGASQDSPGGVEELVVANTETVKAPVDGSCEESVV